MLLTGLLLEMQRLLLVVMAMPLLPAGRGLLLLVCSKASSPGALALAGPSGDNELCRARWHATHTEITLQRTNCAIFAGSRCYSARERPNADAENVAQDWTAADML